MRPRSQLHTLLLALHSGITVYFQPPTKEKLVYPCIKYELDDVQPEFADNIPYMRTKKYLLTVIVDDPDSDIPDKVGALPMCMFDRHFAADQLNHYVFTLFF
jgi:hypothetical protein